MKNKEKTYEFSTAELLNDENLLSSFEQGEVYEILKAKKENVVSSKNPNDLEEKFNLALKREAELGRTTEEQNKEVEALGDRDLMVSEVVIAFEGAQDRGYIKPFEVFYKDLKNGDFSDLPMIDAGQYKILKETIPAPLRTEDYSNVTLQETIDGIRQGVGSLFKKYDMENVGMSYA